MSGSPWILIVVRAWVQGDSRMIRMTLSGTRPGGRPVVCYETSSAEAGRRLSRWLEELSAPPGAGDVSEDGALMVEGRPGDGDRPTLAPAPATSPRPEET